MFNQKFILISLTAIVLVSFSFLAISENKQHLIKDGWFLYFNNIEGDSLDFTIENYSNTSDFTWETSVDGKSLNKQYIKVLKGKQKDVRINELPEIKGRQIKITVYKSKEIKEIYKNFDK